MKRFTMVFILLFVISLSFLAAQTTDNPALFPILHNFSARAADFTTQPITSAELDIIVRSGLRAPSAGNRQPWLFTVVQNITLARQILPNITDGNVLIVISGVGDGATNGAVMLDCGLAAMNMFIAAQAMGLGARQYTNSALINRANGLKAQLGMPDNHSAIIVTQYGRLPASVDAVSSASARANPDTKVVYR